VGGRVGWLGGGGWFWWGFLGLGVVGFGGGVGGVVFGTIARSVLGGSLLRPCRRRAPPQSQNPPFPFDISPSSLLCVVFSLPPIMNRRVRDMGCEMDSCYFNVLPSALFARFLDFSFQSPLSPTSFPLPLNAFFPPPFLPFKFALLDNMS